MEVEHQQTFSYTPLKIKVKGSKSSWYSLISQVYLMLKYNLLKMEQRKKTVKPKLKGM